MILLPFQKLKALENELDKPLERLLPSEEL